MLWSYWLTLNLLVLSSVHWQLGRFAAPTEQNKNIISLNAKICWKVLNFREYFDLGLNSFGSSVGEHYRFAGVAALIPACSVIFVIWMLFVTCSVLISFSRLTRVSAMFLTPSTVSTATFSISSSWTTIFSSFSSTMLSSFSSWTITFSIFSSWTITFSSFSSVAATVASTCN